MTEPQIEETQTPAWTDAAARNDAGQYLHPETGEAFEGEYPEPVPGALPWTNQDVLNMSQGQPPTRPEPTLPDSLTGVVQPDGSVLSNVPGQVDLDLKAVPINVTPDGVNHFRLAREGVPQDVCGGCGADWPCEKAASVAASVAEAHGAGESAHRLQAAAAIVGGAPHDLVGKLGPS